MRLLDTKRRTCAFALACVSMLWFREPSSASAYSDPEFFYKPVLGLTPDGRGPFLQGGSSGRWFTGSPSDGYACDVCHTPGPTANPKLLPPQQPPRGEPLPAGPLIVEGLPTDGYVPGKVYDVRLTWPAYAARARAGYQSGQPLGYMGIVAELVADSGKDSGLLDVRHQDGMDPAENCLVPPYILATQLYRQPIEPYFNDEGVPQMADRPASSTCTARDGTRCLVVVRGCGSEQATFVWTAPEQFQGTLWFSAGYVATDQRTSDPAEDSVTLVSLPLAPAASPSQASTLTASSCSVSSAQLRSTPATWLALGLALGFWRQRRVRRTQKRARTLGTLAWVALFLTACAADGSGEASTWQLRDAWRCVGAYELDDDACFGDELPAGHEALSGDFWNTVEAVKKNTLRPRCDGVPNLTGASATAGRLTATIVTNTYDGRYAPANSGAIWIETVPLEPIAVGPIESRERVVESGDYVRSMQIWAAARLHTLMTYNSARCATSPEADIISSATLPDHSMAHTLTWDGTDWEGNVAPDGEYVLWLEITEDELVLSTTQRVIFSKGPAPTTRSVKELKGVTSIDLSWLPGTAAATATAP